MRRIFGVRNAFQLIAKRFRAVQHRPFCDSNSSIEKGRRLTKTSSDAPGGDKIGDIRELDVYRDLDKLDFMKAAKILFTHPPKNKKFGLDFHLVQLFFVCMPSLAVYLVAQYARSEMRRMDAELDVKKKAEDEAKEKEIAAAKEKEGKSASDLLEVKEKLLALEKTVNEIVVETRQNKSTDTSSGKTRPNNTAVSDPNQFGGSVTDDKGKLLNEGSSDAKK